MEIWGAATRRVATCLTVAETRAALAAARRAGRLGQKEHNKALNAFQRLRADLHLIGVDEELADVAGALAEEHGLRGYDAAHLATALALGPEVVMITWDDDLGNAVSERGGLVIPHR